jgi:hypothetical protein
VLGEKFFIDARFVVVTFEICAGHQLYEVVIAFEIFGQHNEMEVVFFRIAGASGFVITPAGRDIHLATDDRFNAFLARNIVELDGAKKIAVIGDRYRIHSERLNLVDQLFNLASAIQQTVIRMKM